VPVPEAETGLRKPTKKRFEKNECLDPEIKKKKLNSVKQLDERI